MTIKEMIERLNHEDNELNFIYGVSIEEIVKKLKILDEMIQCGLLWYDDKNNKSVLLTRTYDIEMIMEYVYLINK